MRWCSSSRTRIPQPCRLTNVYDIGGMFSDAVSFNQDLSTWTNDIPVEESRFAPNTPAWTLPKPSFVIPG